MPPVILFRRSAGQDYELEFARRYFDVETCRSRCRNRLVIGRYSTLPFHRELEDDLSFQGCNLVNTTDQHDWIANFDWYEELGELTPQTWREDEFFRCTDPGPFVVKGATNSKKKDWSSLMFAKDKRTAVEIGIKLREDSLIAFQPLVYRKYVPLVTHEVGINGLPFAEEWRFFYYGDRRIAHGFYWSTSEYAPFAKISDDGLDFADHVAKIASRHANFFVIDIAKTQDRRWIVIELNDATMSGLSEIDPDTFYKNLAADVGER